MVVGQDFALRTDPYRRELLAHCYRMLGSVQDAEDLVQETFLAAWRGLDGFEGRASLRTWLYRIATNRCLNALRDASRRPDEVELPENPPEPTRVGEVLWLQPLPDEQYETREAVGLAFVTGLQHLPPTQRAALVLKDVLGFRAAEVADMLETTPAAVNSGLQRARASLEERVPSPDRAPAPRSPAERAIVTRFADAFQAGDVDTIVTLLTDDAWLTMPPAPLEYQGRRAIGAFLTNRADHRGTPLRLVATRANGQPAFACSLPSGEPYGMLVVTLRGDRISAMTWFAGG